MSDLSSKQTSSRAIPLRRAIVGGVALLVAGFTFGTLLTEMSGPTMASAPKSESRGSGLENVGTDGSNPISTGQLADVVRNQQERSSALQSTVPFNTADPLQKTGPIDGLIATGAGAMPMPPGDLPTPQERWTTVNDRVATVLRMGTPSAETLEQLVAQASAVTPASSPTSLAGGPSSPPTPAPSPLPPTVYEGTAKASPN